MKAVPHTLLSRLIPLVVDKGHQAIDKLSIHLKMALDIVVGIDLGYTHTGKLTFVCNQLYYPATCGPRAMVAALRQ